MGQFMPEIEDVFKEIKKYKAKLEGIINSEIVDCNSKNTIRSYATNLEETIKREIVDCNSKNTISYATNSVNLYAKKPTNNKSVLK